MCQLGPTNIIYIDPHASGGVPAFLSELSSNSTTLVASDLTFPGLVYSFFFLLFILWFTIMDFDFEPPIIQ